MRKPLWRRICLPRYIGKKQAVYILSKKFLRKKSQFFTLVGAVLFRLSLSDAKLKLLIKDRL